MEKRNQAAKLIVGAVIVIIAILALAGIVSQHHITYKSAPLSRDDIVYKQVEAPQASSADGTITASDWSAVYPHIAVSMGSNKENDVVVDYLELDPYLVEIYEGYGFAKDYGSARGHSYTLEDVAKTKRPHPFANCLTCKTPNFTKMAQDTNEAAYALPFDEVYAQITQNGGETVSCYTCHGNNPGNGTKPKENLTVTHEYINLALGEKKSTIDPGILACGQCHIEYYFDPATKATRMPHNSIEAMTPEATYDYYTQLGFSDWTQESTGAKMLKVQHPEMETVLLGKHADTLNCADCHMPVVQDPKDRTIYHSHMLVSPLEDETLLATCLQCHSSMDPDIRTGDDMIEMVRSIQKRVTEKETTVGNRLADFKKALAEANQSGKYTEEQLDGVRELYRKAQWFFDYCYVENSEGAHNYDLAMRCLNTAEDLIDEGTALLQSFAE